MSRTPSDPTAVANGTPETALVPRQQPSWNAIHSLAEAVQIAELAHKSCLFPGIQTAAAALMKILCGAELGFGPFASLADVHIIEGKAVRGAHLLAASIRASDRYDYEVIRRDDAACDLECWERTGAPGAKHRKGSAGWEPKQQHITVTLDGLKTAGVAIGKDGKLKANYQRHARSMLFARAISELYRTYCADLSGGVLAYTPEEMERDDEPASGPSPASSRPVIDVTPEPAVTPSPPPLTLIQLADEHRRSPSERSSICIAAGVSDLDQMPPEKEARVRALIIQGQATPAQADACNELSDRLGIPHTKRLERLKARYGVTSFAHLTIPEADSLIQLLTKEIARQADARNNAPAATS